MVQSIGVLVFLLSSIACPCAAPSFLSTTRPAWRISPAVCRGRRGPGVHRFDHGDHCGRRRSRHRGDRGDRLPECLEGRVKTLHPRIHAGILADRRKQEHIDTFGELDVEPFDLVVVNLYPFVETVASGADQDAIIEKIDIGGPSMVRAAAKNHDAVVVVDPADYERTVEAQERWLLAGGAPPPCCWRIRPHRRLRHRRGYLDRIQFLQDEDANFWPPYAGPGLPSVETLRYGENLHQRAALYVNPAAAPALHRPSSCTARP